MGGGRWQRCCFIRSGQGRPLSKSQFELRSRGGKIRVTWEKNILVSGQKIQKPQSKTWDLFEEGTKCRRKQVMEALYKEFRFHFKSSGSLGSTMTLEV